MTVAAQFVSLAHELADAARPVVRKYFRKPIPIDEKSDASPVTIADREVESRLREIIRAHYPDHGIFGEEWGRENEGARFTWVIDPIDGTGAFITGKPSFGTLIALCDYDRPILGVIDQAITDERWIGGDGVPTTLNGQPISVRQCPDLGAAYAYTTGPDFFCANTLPAWERIAANVKRARYGCDCYAYGLVAVGSVDLVVEAGLKPYDYAALVPVIENAGGIVTDWQGHPVTITSGGQICAAGDKRVHAQALALLQE